MKNNFETDSGAMRLEVPCDCPHVLREMSFLPADADKPTCKLCKGTGKRPMTEQEVEELLEISFIKDEETTMNFILTGIEYGMYTINNKPITLSPAPREEE